MLWADRKFANEEEEERIKAAMIINNPEMYRRVYADVIAETEGDGSGDETYSLDEIDDLKAFFDSIDFEHTVTAEVTEGEWL